MQFHSLLSRTHNSRALAAELEDARLEMTSSLSSDEPRNCVTSRKLVLKRYRQVIHIVAATYINHSHERMSKHSCYQMRSVISARAYKIEDAGGQSRLWVR